MQSLATARLMRDTAKRLALIRSESMRAAKCSPAISYWSTPPLPTTSSLRCHLFACIGRTHLSPFPCLNHARAQLNTFSTSNFRSATAFLVISADTLPFASEATPVSSPTGRLSNRERPSVRVGESWRSAVWVLGISGFGNEFGADVRERRRVDGAGTLPQ
jgi:hypothetical protein